MVSDAQKGLLKSSWASADHKAVGLNFYSNLETRCPDVYAVFKLGAGAKTDPKAVAQAGKVVAFVDDCVSHIGDTSAVKAKVDALGARHTSYGATKAHFGSAKACFVDAVGASGDTKAAWAALYDVISAGICAHL